MIGIGKFSPINLSYTNTCFDFDSIDFFKNDKEGYLRRKYFTT